jgi:hypothetical protein
MSSRGKPEDRSGERTDELTLELSLQPETAKKLAKEFGIAPDENTQAGWKKWDVDVKKGVIDKWPNYLHITLCVVELTSSFTVEQLRDKFRRLHEELKGIEEEFMRETLLFSPGLRTGNGFVCIQPCDIVRVRDALVEWVLRKLDCVKSVRPSKPHITLASARYSKPEKLERKNLEKSDNQRSIEINWDWLNVTPKMHGKEVHPGYVWPRLPAHMREPKPTDRGTGREVGTSCSSPPKNETKVITQNQAPWAKMLAENKSG